MNSNCTSPGSWRAVRNLLDNGCEWDLLDCNSRCVQLEDNKLACLGAQSDRAVTEPPSGNSQSIPVRPFPCALHPLCLSVPRYLDGESCYGCFNLILRGKSRKPGQDQWSTHHGGPYVGGEDQGGLLK
jgi:hypothetical protein